MPACAHASARVRVRKCVCVRLRVQVCMCVRVFEAEVARLFTSCAHLCGSVYAQASEAVLLVGFAVQRARGYAPSPQGHRRFGWRSLSVNISTSSGSAHYEPLYIYMYPKANEVGSDWSTISCPVTTGFYQGEVHERKVIGTMPLKKKRTWKIETCGLGSLTWA